MTDPRSLKLARIAPSILALICLAFVYSAALWATNQRTLAASLAAIAAIVGYMACRLVQLRGRVTLAMTVIGLPLLTAMTFTAFRQLTPFIDRQRSYERLRIAGIGFWVREPAQLGEWTQDFQGNILPNWLANRIGPECMNALRSIDGELKQLQSFSYQDLETSTLKFVTINRDGSETDISQDFVDWLGDLQLDGMHLNLRLSPYDDAKGIVASSVQLIANVVAKHSRPRWLSSSIYFRIEAAALSPETVQVLSDLPDGTKLTLSGARLEVRSLTLLADQGHESLWLRKVRLTDLAGLNSGGSQTTLRDLYLLESKKTIDHLRHLTRIFKCETLSTWSEVTDEELESLWSNSNLREISVFGSNQRTRRFSRPLQ